MQTERDRATHSDGARGWQKEKQGDRSSRTAQSEPAGAEGEEVMWGELPTVWESPVPMPRGPQAMETRQPQPHEQTPVPV